MVDWLDFPLRPPDGEGTWGGGDYGVYREHFQGYHAGEDWSIFRTRSMGEPVFSIGHGMVTYAQPRGWGRDGGVVIIQHVLEDWSRVLSFYGHLDPSSVNLRAGDCVRRGDRVGEIGDRYHLHFELRVHMPNQPGPGYWGVDPTLAGWLPPSEFIIEQRLGVTPGLLWMSISDEQTNLPIGMLDEHTFLLLEGRNLVGIDMGDGTEVLRFSIERNYAQGVVDNRSRLVYLADRHGYLDGYELPIPLMEGESDVEVELLEPDWRIKFPDTGTVKLMLQPGEGVLVSIAGGIFNVSDSGEQIWQLEGVPLVNDWILDGENLIYSIVGEQSAVGIVTSGEQSLVVEGVGGQLIMRGDHILVYDPHGLYLLDPQTQDVELFYPLPTALPELGDVVSIDGGGYILMHRDLSDQRLIAFNPDGSILWEESFKDKLVGEPNLIDLDGQNYIVLKEKGRFHSRVRLVKIDTSNGNLTYIFEGGVRDLVLQNSWVFGVDQELILINIEGYRLAVDLNVP